MTLVLGASGGIGGTVASLLGPGARPAFRDPARVASTPGAVLVDFDDPATLGPALAGVSTLLLVSAAGPRQAAQEIAVVRAAVAAGVAHVVKVSVWRAPERLSPFATAARDVEEVIEASPLSWTFLRPNFFMQNFLRSAPDIRATGEFTQPATDAPISFVDARDVARAAAAILRAPAPHAGQAYALTGPSALTYRDAAAVLTAELGRPVRYRPQSDPEARATLTARGVPAYHRNALLAVAHTYRPGGASPVTLPTLTRTTPTPFPTFIHTHRTAFLP
jgi:uncharacterized protein YbjT (DUF2867 family)